MSDKITRYDTLIIYHLRFPHVYDVSIAALAAVPVITAVVPAVVVPAAPFVATSSTLILNALPKAADTAKPKISPFRSASSLPPRQRSSR